MLPEDRLGKRNASDRVSSSNVQFCARRDPFEDFSQPVRVPCGFVNPVKQVMILIGMPALHRSWRRGFHRSQTVARGNKKVPRTSFFPSNFSVNKANLGQPGVRFDDLVVIDRCKDSERVRNS